MYELHENEQYFFDAATLSCLADFLEQFQNPLCLCAPMLGRELQSRRREVAVFDCDERFADLPKFHHYDIFRPAWIDEKFDVIVCDPPFFKVSLSQLFSTIRLLSHYEYSQPLLIAYLARRGDNLCGTFSKFNLQPTNCFARYQTVRSHTKNDIAFFSNLSAEEIAVLKNLFEK